MAWTWRLIDPDGDVTEAVAVPPASSQADAESWLGENWRELADAGVAQVTLVDSGSDVYGPMPLSE